jgi:hypothetical protein
MKLLLGDFSKLPLFVKKNVGKEPRSVKSGKPPAPIPMLGLKAKFYGKAVYLLK